MEVVVRIMRRYIHFPIPAPIARFIDNPLRRKLQPPSKVIDWMDIRSGMCILEVGCGPGTLPLKLQEGPD
ncbi:MAG: hypothetical protein NDF55_09815 [archaeon GB-1867-005]|nr:hypothetical protein [Candidatus Culexmicrobium cathedralense]